MRWHMASICVCAVHSDDGGLTAISIQNLEVGHHNYVIV